VDGGGGPPGETLGERMVRRLEEGLNKKRDLEGLFAELEAMAGLEPGAADDAENPFDRAGEPGDAAAAAAGNLGPLVEEFLWETGAQEGDDHEKRRALPEGGFFDRAADGQRSFLVEYSHRGLVQ
jgi:hypothetical protein